MRASLLGLVGVLLLAPAQVAPAPVNPDCRVPLSWSLAELDDAFGLAREEAEAAIRQAAGVWNDVAGRTLFHHDERDGFPIRFVHDERHAAIQASLQRRAELDEQRRLISERRADLEAAGAELARARAEHDRQVDDLERRMATHRQEVRYWNERGGAPEAQLRELRQAEEALARERAQVNARADSLNEEARRVNRETDQLNRMVEDFNRASAGGAEAGGGRIESGRYHESRRTIGSWVVSVEREIQIFQFDDRNHLIRVLAHELGHALQLGHVGEPGALMYIYADGRGSQAGGDAPLQLHPRDVELLREQCPAAFGG
jgi:hypothetical protein